MSHMSKVLFAVALAACAAGCASKSYVKGNVREGIPQYPSERQVAAPNVNAVVYPIPDAGDSEKRKMLESGRNMLLDGMKAAGYGIVSCNFADVRSRNVGVVELVDCHSTTERSYGDVASLVTVVAICVRKPGVLEDGRITCGRVRSFQGVFRYELGRKPHDFSLSDDERLAGIRGAVDNIMKIAQFKEAVEECNGVK